MVNDFCNQDFYNPVKWILSIYGNWLPGFGSDRKLKGHNVIYNCCSPRWDEQLLWGVIFHVMGDGNWLPGFGDRKLKGHNVIYNCCSPCWDEQLLWGSFFMLWRMEIGYPVSVVIGGSKVTMSYTNVVPLNGTNNFCRGDFLCYGECKLDTRDFDPEGGHIRSNWIRRLHIQTFRNNFCRGRFEIGLVDLELLTGQTTDDRRQTDWAKT